MTLSTRSGVEGVEASPGRFFFFRSPVSVTARRVGPPARNGRPHGRPILKPLVSEDRATESGVGHWRLE